MTEPVSIKATDVLQAGIDAIGNRAAQRDLENGERSMALAVRIFMARTDIKLSEYEGWIFMACLKAARGAQGAFNLDDAIDEAAHIALAAECRSRDLSAQYVEVNKQDIELS